jgi:hypothetical protein
MMTPLHASLQGRLISWFLSPDVEIFWRIVQVGRRTIVQQPIARAVGAIPTPIKILGG